MLSNLSVLYFAAGLGTRMRPLTIDRPKPLIPVGDTTLLDHALRITKSQRVTARVINIHYKGKMIRDHLADETVQFSDETIELLDTGGGLKNALPLLKSNPIVTTNTDAVWNGPNPIDALADAWSDDMECLLLVVPPERAAHHDNGGDFTLNADRLTRGGSHIYTGVQILKTDRLANIKERVFSLNKIWDAAEADGNLFGLEYSGYWCDVGTPEAIPYAQKMIGSTVV